ncbi:MAG: gas vesicle protein GvpJ [Desulfobaccales bacterium]
MGMWLICPHCRANAPLASRACPQCGADLSRLPMEQRHYYVGRPEPEMPGPAFPDPGPWPENLVLETPTGEALIHNSSWYAEPEDDQLDPDADHVSLCEALDRILNKGAVVVGEVMISVANIDLIYLGLQLILTSIDTARELRSAGAAGLSPGVAP